MQEGLDSNQWLAAGTIAACLLLALLLFLRTRRKKGAAAAPAAHVAAPRLAGRPEGAAGPVAKLAPALDPTAATGPRAARRAAVAWLDGAGESYDLAAGDTLLGRGGDGIDLAGDHGVSAEHALIRCEDGTCTVYDLASANGTYLNDQRLLAPEPLKEGDRIRVGSTVLKFRTRPAAGAARGQAGRPDRASGAAAAHGAAGGTEVLPQGGAPAEPQAPQPAAQPVAAGTKVLPAEVAWLLVTEGPHAGLCTGVLPGALTVGRQPAAGGMALPKDDSVSREHLRIQAGDGGMTVRDLGSTNGTRLNGNRLAGEAPLQVGDHLRVGESTIQVVKEKV